MVIKFTIPLAPVTKKNSQRIVLVHNRPMVLPSKVYKDYGSNDRLAILKKIK